MNKVFTDSFKKIILKGVPEKHPSELFLRKNLTLLLEIFSKINFEKNDGNWVDVLPVITNQYNNRIHSSTKKRQFRLLLKKLEDFSTKTF